MWAELTALEPAVREEPLYSYALAVARETMRGARHNLQLIIARLGTIGYRFASPHGGFSGPPADNQAQLDAAEQEYGVLQLSLCVWYETVGNVSLLGDHPKLNVYYDDGWDNPPHAPFADPLCVNLFDPIEYYSPTLHQELQQRIGRFASVWIVPNRCFKMPLSS